LKCIPSGRRLDPRGVVELRDWFCSRVGTKWLNLRQTVFSVSLARYRSTPGSNSVNPFTSLKMQGLSRLQETCTFGSDTVAQEREAQVTHNAF
jgi:hypothetical protein